MDTHDTAETPDSPQGPTTSGPSRTSRPWGRYAVVAGVSALALAGAATIGAVASNGPRMEAAGDVGADRVIVMPARSAAEHARSGEHRGPRMMDPAARAEQRAARLAALATELGIDADALTAAADALHTELDAERDALREELTDATVEERREARLAFAEERRTRMRELLIGLGADADTVDALLADHAADHGPMSRRGPRAGHSGGR
jgi:hypothetical protein